MTGKKLSSGLLSCKIQKIHISFIVHIDIQNNYEYYQNSNLCILIHREITK